MLDDGDLPKLGCNPPTSRNRRGSHLRRRRRIPGDDLFLHPARRRSSSGPRRLAAVRGHRERRPLVNRAPSCDFQPLSKPFLPWADMALYTPAPGGTAESKGGWQLSRGAGVAQGDEPWNVRLRERQAAPRAGRRLVGDHRCDLRSASSTDDALLARPDRLRPAQRAGRRGAVRDGARRRDVRPDRQHSGRRRLVAAARVPSDGQPPRTASRRSHAPVAFRFTPLGSAGWSVDDVYVDPFGRT